jgi:DNA-directed RNA polymerase specialized sigma24 family protein
MELPIGTVMSRLARAKAYLRAKLSPNGSDLAAAGRKEVSDAVS